MINTIVPQALATIDKDGKKITVPVPPSIILLRQGAQIQIGITHPQSVIEKLIRENKQPAALLVNALIDTGASNCVISPKIAEQLNLVQTGYRKITSVQDEQDRPVYYCRFNFQWGSGKDISAASCPLKGFDCIIGRDILMHWNFIYNGVNGIITICD